MKRHTILISTVGVMLSGLGAPFTFFIYGIINMAMIFFVAKYVFETKGVSLEKIEELYVAF